jgi:hypothetical protein
MERYGRRGAYIKIIRKPSKRRDQYYSIQWNSENFVVNIFWRAVPASHCIDIYKLDPLNNFSGLS